MSENKKTFYHSAAAQEGPVRCLVKSDVLESKYKKGSFYAIMVVNGVEKNYTVENATCGERLKGLKGKECTLTFTGSRDDADIVVSAVAGGSPQQQQSQPPQGNQQPAAAPPQQQRQAPKGKKTPAEESADINECKRRQTQLGNLFEISLTLATIIATRWNEKNKSNQSLRPMGTEDIRCMANSLQIGGERQCNYNLLPAHLMPDAAPKGGAR